MTKQQQLRRIAELEKRKDQVSVDDRHIFAYYELSPEVRRFVTERRKRADAVRQMTGAAIFDHDVVIALLGNEIPEVHDGK